MRNVEDREVLERLLRFNDAAVATDILPFILETKALLHGDFELSGGRYSRYFLRFGQLAWSTAALAKIAEHLVGTMSFSEPPRFVRCCETAAYSLGQAVAEKLGAATTVLKADNSRKPTREVRHGDEDMGAPTLVVTDVITTGGSVRRLCEGLKNPVGVAAFAVSSPERALMLHDELHLDVHHLLATGWETDDAPPRGAHLVPARELN